MTVNEYYEQMQGEAILNRDPLVILDRAVREVEEETGRAYYCSDCDQRMSDGQRRLCDACYDAETEALDEDLSERWNGIDID